MAEALEVNRARFKANPRLKILKVNSQQHDAMSQIGLNASTVDIFIDDAEHTLDAQQNTLAALFDLVKPGGFYIIEDVGTITAGEQPFDEPSKLTPHTNSILESNN